MARRDLAAEFHADDSQRPKPNRGRPKGTKEKPGLRAANRKRRHDVKSFAIQMLSDPAYRKSLKKRLREGTCPSIESKLYEYAYGKPREQGVGEGDIQKQLDRFRVEAVQAIRAAQRKPLPPSQVKLLMSGEDVVDAERT